MVFSVPALYHIVICIIYMPVILINFRIKKWRVYRYWPRLRRVCFVCMSFCLSYELNYK